LAAQAGFQLAIGKGQCKISLEVPVMPAANRSIVLLRFGVRLAAKYNRYTRSAVIKIVVLIGAVIYVGGKFLALLFVFVVKVDVKNQRRYRCRAKNYFG